MLKQAKIRTVLVSLLVVSAYAGAQEYEISRSTFDGGGAMFSTGGDFELSGTIGQPDAGMMMSADGVFTLEGGFWGGIEGVGVTPTPTPTLYFRSPVSKSSTSNHSPPPSTNV